MTLINHLAAADTKRMFHTLAYGRHVINGFLAKSIVTGSSSSYQITLQQLLGRDEWDGVDAVYWNNLSIPSTDWAFHPGKLTTGNTDAAQGVDPVFNTDVPHSLIPWLRAALPGNVADFDTKGSPPVGLQVYARTKKLLDYDASGNVIGYSYSANPARIVADLILRQGRRSKYLINWSFWTTWRDFCETAELHDYRTLANFDGFGLTANYCNGTNFETFITKRIDNLVSYPYSYGAPAYGQSADNFSARYEGFVKPLYSENYTFYLTHDDGGRLYIDDVLIIDKFVPSSGVTDSATVNLTAGTFHKIKVEWYGAVAPSTLLLEWSSASQSKQVVPSKNLYPLAENYPRYEAHPFFSAPTRLDEAVRTVLNLCNSTVQKVNGQYRFFCFEQITTSSFDFNENNIISIKARPRDRANLRNKFSATFRDLDSRFLEPPPKSLVAQRQALIALAGRTIDGDDLNFFNMRRFQAYKLLNKIIARECDTLPVEIVGNSDTFPVLAGDKTRITSEIYNWTDKPFLVTTSNDASSEDTPDERNFNLLTIDETLTASAAYALTAADGSLVTDSAGNAMTVMR